jgi:hypothetical protein
VFLFLKLLRGGGEKMIPVNNRFEEIKHYIRTRSWYKNHETLLELRKKIQDLAHNKEDQEDLLCSRTSTATF